MVMEMRDRFLWARLALYVSLLFMVDWKGMGGVSLFLLAFLLLSSWAAMDGVACSGSGTPSRRSPCPDQLLLLSPSIGGRVVRLGMAWIALFCLVFGWHSLKDISSRMREFYRPSLLRMFRTDSEQFRDCYRSFQQALGTERTLGLLTDMDDAGESMLIHYMLEYVWWPFRFDAHEPLDYRYVLVIAGDRRWMERTIEGDVPLLVCSNMLRLPVPRSRYWYALVRRVDNEEP